MRSCVGQVLRRHMDGLWPSPSAQPHLRGLCRKSCSDVEALCILKLPRSFVASC